MAVIGSLSVKLGLVTVEWSAATAEAKQKALALKASMDTLGGGVKELNGLWKAMGGSLAIGAVGMVSLLAQTAAFADRMQDLADSMGISTGFALQFSDGLQKAGLSGDAATKIIGKLFDTIDSAKEGNQKSIDQFRKLGISFSEIKELKPEDAIRRVVASLAQLQKEDPIKYVAELRRQLGKGGLGLDAGELNSVIEGGVGKWQNYGDSIKAVSKLKDNLTASNNNLMIAFSKFVGPIVHDGTVSVEKFTGALAGLATYFVAAKVITYAAALTEFVIAMRAATAAGAAFNIMSAGSPLLLALKLAAMGTAFVVYKNASDSGANTPPAFQFDKEVGDPFAMPTAADLQNSKSGSATSDYSPDEKAAAISLQTEKIKTLNNEALNALPVWDSFGKSIVSIGVEASNSLEQLNSKRAELAIKYKDSDTLLALELDKLKEQEKQIVSNTQKKIIELQYQRQLTVENAKISLTTEQLKTLNAEALNGIPYWDSFTKSIVAVGVESSNAFEGINAKRAELQLKYQDSPELLGLELAKLKEQEKQIIRNTAHKIKELQTQREIVLISEEQVRLAGYLVGIQKTSDDQTKVRLDQAKTLLDIQQQEIDNEAELNKLRLDRSASLVGVGKTMASESAELQRSLAKLQSQLQALPEFINMPEEMLSNEAKANNDRITAIQAQMSFEKERHNLKMSNLQNEQTFEYGFQNSMSTYLDNAENMAKQGADSFNSMTSNMNSALDNFVKTGKLSFKDLARSIIQDLIAIQLRASASGIFRALFSATVGPSMDGGGPLPSSFDQFIPKADGGSVAGNSRYLVGERGPEMFVPSASGTIIPNGAMQGMGGTTNVTNNYINAIDTKSFEERLYGSSNAIWAANQYANKSLAVNRGRA